jgi:hypothetical protein
MTCGCGHQILQGDETVIRNKMHREIFNTLGRYANWDNDRGMVKNEEARQALVKVLSLCKKLKPDKFYESRGYFGHLDYLRCLLQVRKALADGLYMRACNELLDVIHLQPYTQARILNNIIALLSEYL